jgi:CheY-like chemotaxis protein
MPQGGPRNAKGGKPRPPLHWIRGGAHCAEIYGAVIASAPAAANDAAAALPEGYFGTLLQALRQQPPDRRSAFALLAVEGLSPTEAGAVLGRDPEVVRLLANAAREAVLTATTAGDGARILVAEDERIAAFELREVLRGLGHRVVALAATAGEAISRASFERPDLAIVDVRLKGGTDGIAALREMRHAFGVPAIVITAFEDQRGRAEGEAAANLGLQAYGFLVKPWGEGDLRNAVADALIRIAVERAAGAPPSFPPAGDPDADAA